MSHFIPNVKMPFKGSNSLPTALSWCKGIMTLKSHFPHSHEDKPVKKT